MSADVKTFVTNQQEEGRMSATDELARHREEQGWPEDERQPPDPGRSAAQHAEDDDEDQPELFPLGSLAGDPKRTYKNMIPAGTQQRTLAKLSNVQVPMPHGLYAFGERGEALVTFEAGRYSPTPEFGPEGPDGSRKVNAVKIVQELRAIYVQDGSDMFTHAQVVDLLTAAGVPADRISELLGA